VAVGGRGHRRPEAFNGGDQSKIVGSIGITLTY
jgi:hypothetical protein